MDKRCPEASFQKPCVLIILDMTLTWCCLSGLVNKSALNIPAQSLEGSFFCNRSEAAAKSSGVHPQANDREQLEASSSVFKQGSVEG